MPGKTPHSNRANGVRKSKDAEAKDHSKSKSKKASKDADEEMTVVVPPSKKQAASKPADADGDVAMGGEEEEKVPEVDPAEQAVAGKLKSLHGSVFMPKFKLQA